MTNTTSAYPRMEHYICSVCGVTPTTLIGRDGKWYCLGHAPSRVGIGLLEDANTSIETLRRERDAALARCERLKRVYTAGRAYYAAQIKYRVATYDPSVEAATMELFDALDAALADTHAPETP